MIHLTPHPISQSEAARSLSSRSGTAKPLPPWTEGYPEVASADDSARKPTPRSWSPTLLLLLGFWLASVAVGLRMMNPWYVVGIVGGASFGTFLILAVRKQREWIAIRLRHLFGEVEWTVGDFCAICDDVHAGGVKCIRAMLGRCIDCGTRGMGRWRSLDRFGNCSSCGSSSVVNRMLRYPNARKRACCESENAQ
jgi:hypothetical protein